MDPDLAVSISAAVIALSALGVSVWEGAATRRHNRLSVLPRLRIDFRYSSGKEIRVVLLNSGLGPAIIRGYTVRLDSKPVLEGVLTPLPAAILELGYDRSFHAYTPSLGDAIFASERITLLLLEFEDGELSRAESMRDNLSRVEIRIDYESMYGDRQSLSVTGLGTPA